MRSKLLSRFLTLYIFTLIATAFFVINPSLLLLALYMTMGLALPLFFAPALALYMTVLLPGVAIAAFGGSRRIAALVAAIAVTATALIAPYTAQLIAERDAKTIATTNVIKKLSRIPPVIELHIPTPFYGGPDDALRNAPCESICQEMLLTKQVKVVRVVGELNSKAVNAVSYRLATLSSCPKAFADENIILDAVRRAASYGNCIVASPGGVLRGDAKLTKSIMRYDGKQATFFHVPKETVTYVLAESVYGQWIERSRFVEFKTAVLAIPLLPSFENIGDSRARTDWTRTEKTFNQLTPRRVLELATSSKLAEPPKPLAEADVEFTKRVLARPGTAPFGPEIMGPINNYLMTLRGNHPISEGDGKILQSLLRDTRINGYVHVMGALEYHPELATPVVGDILTKLEVPVDESRGHDHNALAFILVRSPVAGLIPYSAQILRLARSTDQWHLSPLLHVVGNLSVDGTSLLAQRLHAVSPWTRGAAVRGVCLADAPQKQKLLPELKSVLAFYGGKNYGGNSDLELALVTLSQSGEVETVNNYLALTDDNDRKRLQWAIDNSKCK
jgi:hypothetical protein